MIYEGRIRDNSKTLNFIIRSNGSQGSTLFSLFNNIDNNHKTKKKGNRKEKCLHFKKQKGFFLKNTSETSKIQR